MLLSKQRVISVWLLWVLTLLLLFLHFNATPLFLHPLSFFKWDHMFLSVFLCFIQLSVLSPPPHTRTHTPTLRTMLYSSSPQSLITLLFISLSYFHFLALSSLCLILLFHIIAVSPVFSLPHPHWHVPACLPPFVGLMLDTFPSPLTCSTSYYECHMSPC